MMGAIRGRRSRIGIAAGVVVVTLFALVAAIQAALGTRSAGAMAPPSGADQRHCLSIMQPDDTPRSPALQGTVEAFATATGKRVSLERAAEHICFAATQERDEYVRVHGIVGASGP